jgi:REP element-mobilizing transposase RayT
MARIARVVAPGLPHHVTQRGYRRQDVFFSKADCALYLDILQHHCAKERVAILGYCLMPNHVHLIAVPKAADALSRAIGETHRRYSRHINTAQEWQGHLWQGRFSSFPMDESHLLMAARYIERTRYVPGLFGSRRNIPGVACTPIWRVKLMHWCRLNRCSIWSPIGRAFCVRAWRTASGTRCAGTNEPGAPPAMTNLSAA